MPLDPGSFLAATAAEPSTGCSIGGVDTAVRISDAKAHFRYGFKDMLLKGYQKVPLTDDAILLSLMVPSTTWSRAMCPLQRVNE